MSFWKRIFGTKDSAPQPESPAPAEPSVAASGAPSSGPTPSGPPTSAAPPSGRIPPAATAGLSGPWKARPILISSTFKDMQRERDHLRDHVFPRLEEELRNRRHQLEPIDLRLGVETAQLGTEEARELLVLKVCLTEIQRSRPFLLVVLGDRYGWVPPEDRMSAATQEAGFKTDVRGKSVTALEIEFGVLKEHPDQRRRSFFYLRDPLPYEGMPPAIAADYSDGQPTGQTPRRVRPGRLGWYGYCRAAAVASNFPRSVLRNRASLPLARTSLRMAA